MSNFERRLDARLVVSVAAVGIMSFAGVVVETALNIAFPALMKEFGVTTAVVQWVTTAYLLVLSAIMPISSFLNRRFRNKTLFLAAMAVFVAGTRCARRRRTSSFSSSGEFCRESAPGSPCRSCSTSCCSRRPSENSAS